MPRPSTNHQPAIRAKSIYKYYGDIVALDNVDLSLPARSIIGLVGPNGAGKTTLLRLLLGLAEATSGELSVLGLNARVRRLQIRALTGYLMQKPSFDSWMSVRSVIELSALLSHAKLDRVNEVISLVGLDKQQEQPVGALSGGQLQRLGLASAVVHAPSLLILDEPAASLDPRGRHDILELIRSLKTTGTTIIFSSHLLHDVQRVCDHIVVLNEGKVVKSSSAKSLLRHHDLETIFLEATRS